MLLHTGTGLLKKFPSNGRRANTLDHTLKVMMYELGYVARGLTYAEHSDYRKDSSSMRAHLQEARINAADLATQIRVLCDQLGWDWNELLTDGEERFTERMQELEEEII